MEPTIRQMRYLDALQNTGSFSAAAEICFVTQSTLSAGIKELETILGQPLVNRTRRKISLTPFGEDMLTRTQGILSAVDSMVARAQRNDSPLAGTLRMGVIPTIAPYFLPDILPGLQKAFPQMDLQFTEDLSERLVARMHEGRLDILLLAFPFPINGAVQFPLFEEEFILARKGANQSKRRASLAELEDENLLLLEDGHCLRDHALSACKLQPPSSRKGLSATSLPTLIQMVAHGYGATLLPEMMVNAGALPAGIALHKFKSPAPKRTIGLSWPEKHHRTADFELLAGTIRELQKRSKKPIKRP